MNLYAKAQIDEHQQSIGGGKWIALLGNAHTNQFGDVPGLAELTGGVGVRLAEGSRSSVGPDRGLHDHLGVVRANVLISLKKELVLPTPQTDLQN
jgi:hypothetical protein